MGVSASRNGNFDAEACARQLVELRQNASRPQELPSHLQPANLVEAYAAQQSAIALWPDEIAGWKIGATSKEIQALFQIDEPVYGPVFKRHVHPSPARVTTVQYGHRMLEAEFAFRFRETLPRRQAPHTRERIRTAVDAVIPAFEIVEPRFAALTIGNIPQLVADFCANGGAVLAPPHTDWSTLDLPSCHVRLLVDGQFEKEGNGALVLGDPFNALEWFVNRQQGPDIEPGQFVLAGTMIGIYTANPNQSVEADFGALGSVSIEFTQNA